MTRPQSPSDKTTWDATNTGSNRVQAVLRLHARLHPGRDGLHRLQAVSMSIQPKVRPEAVRLQRHDCYPHLAGLVECLGQLLSINSICTRTAKRYCELCRIGLSHGEGHCCLGWQRAAADCSMFFQASNAGLRPAPACSSRSAQWCRALCIMPQVRLHTTATSSLSRQVQTDLSAHPAASARPQHLRMS